MGLVDQSPSIFTFPLVLESEPVLLPEHVQNLPVLGLGVASATSISELKSAGVQVYAEPRSLLQFRRVQIKALP